MERPAELGLGQPADLGEDVVLDLPTGDGGDLDEAAGLLAGVRQSHEQDAAQRLGQPITSTNRGSSLAATSSSAKNAFPSDRRAIDSTSAGPSRSPAIAPSISTSSSRSNRARSIRSTRGWRSASASQAVSG